MSSIVLLTRGRTWLRPTRTKEMHVPQPGEAVTARATHADGREVDFEVEVLDDGTITYPQTSTVHADASQAKGSSPGACQDMTYSAADRKEYDTYGWWVGDGSMPGGLSRSKVKTQFALAIRHVNRQDNDCDMTQSHEWGGSSRLDGYTTYEADIDSAGHCTPRDHKSTWDGGDLPSSVVALSCYSTDANPGVKNDLKEADVRYNVTDFNFTAKGGSARCKHRYDSQAVAAHETGHIFGLNDLGEGHFLSCHDDELGRELEAESWTAYRVEGIPQRDAVAVQEAGRRPRLYAREGISGQDLRALLSKVDQSSGTRRTGS